MISRRPSSNSVAISSFFAVDLGQQLAAERVGFRLDLIVDGHASRRQHHPLDAPIGAGGLTHHQSRFHQTIHHGYHGGAFDAEAVSQLRLG